MPRLVCWFARDWLLSTAAAAAAAVATSRVQMVVKHGREEEAAAAGGTWHNTDTSKDSLDTLRCIERPHCAQKDCSIIEDSWTCSLQCSATVMFYAC
jgi:hypothetical protein